MSQHGCSLYLNFIHSAELHFYVRGLRFRNLSLLLLLFFFLMNLDTFFFFFLNQIHYILLIFFCQLWTLQCHHLNTIIPLSTLHLYFVSKVIKYDIHIIIQGIKVNCTMKVHGHDQCPVCVSCKQITFYQVMHTHAHTHACMNARAHTHTHTNTHPWDTCTHTVTHKT